MRWIAALTLAASACVQQRFPQEVQTALAHESLRRLETDQFIIYYPAARRAEVERFVARAGRCSEVLHAHAQIHAGAWHDKQVIAMPDVAFNNAFVLPDAGGFESVAVIPLYGTLDFSTEFGLPPDPGFIACHELTHYTQFQQIAGLWRGLDAALGSVYSPQIGYDAWFLEGLATHYEAALSPGLGRPRWPIFTGMFAAAYAGEHVDGGQLNSLNRESHLGHQYLVGTMFVRFLTETYGERGMWAAIADQAHAITGVLPATSLSAALHVPFATLLAQFDAWCKRTFPVRVPPASQHRLATLGNDARYARGLDGTEAWIGDDVDLPPRLIVRDPAGATLAEIPLVGVLPPRTLIEADPLEVSGMSITADGREVWLTVIDYDATFQVPRLLRWRRGGKLEEVATNLGPGGAIDPSGRTYYYAWVDGDRWSLAAWDVDAGRAPRMIREMQPGTYVLAAQVSPDGGRVAASVWNGHAFVVWEIEAATGRVVRQIGGTPEAPVYDPSYTSDGRLMWLGEVDARFQVFVEGVQASDAPYAALAAREANGTIRFMDREKWYWDLAEIPSPSQSTSTSTSTSTSASTSTSTSTSTMKIVGDEPASAWEHLFYPQLRTPYLATIDGETVLGLALEGGDRLGMQRWAVLGYEENSSHFGGYAAYLDTMLSPVAIFGAADFADIEESAVVEPDVRAVHDDHRTRDVFVSASNTYRETLTTAVTAAYSADDTDIAGFEPVHARIGGPGLSMQWESGEVTRYTGPRREFLFSAETAYYPRELSSFRGDIEDVGGSLGTVLPLPFGRRHTLSLGVRGRALLARDDTGLLELGGQTALTELYSGSSTSEAAPTFATLRFPGDWRFTEPLRGYEDYAITTDRAAIADADWRYPLVIDRGVAAPLGWLPETFVRELDFEAFASGAVDRAGNDHGAAGGAITLRIELFRVPLIVTYQLARRLFDDRALTQLVGVALDQ